MSIAEWLRKLFPFLLGGAYLAALWINGTTQFDQGYRKGQAEGAKALAELRLEHAEADTQRAQAAQASAEQATQQLQAAQVRADKLAGQLADQQRQHRTNRDRLQKEIARVSTLYRKALDAAPEPVPACVFTRGWVRLYDQATGAELPAGAADSSGAAAPTTQAAAAEQLDSGVSQAGVLDHHIDYAEQCRNTAAQLERLIDLLEMH